MSAYSPVLSQVVTQGVQKTVRLPIVDANGDRLNLTATTIVATVIDPVGAVLTPAVNIETQSGETLGICNFVLTTVETAVQIGKWKIRFTVDGEPVAPGGFVGYVINGCAV